MLQFNVGKPFERIIIVNPFLETDSRIKYIFVAMDYFSKWTLSNHEAATIAEVLAKEFFSRLGVSL